MSSVNVYQPTEALARSVDEYVCRRPHADTLLWSALARSRAPMRTHTRPPRSVVAGALPPGDRGLPVHPNAAKQHVQDEKHERRVQW